MLRQRRAEHAEKNKEIDATTVVTAWTGERMNDSAIIERLQSKDRLLN